MRFQILIQYQNDETEEVLHLIEQNIERTIQESYNAALTLALTVNDNGEVKNFNAVAEQIFNNSDVVDVLELVPDGVIEYVYPLEGNESVLGYDIKNDPKVSAEVNKAAELGTIYFAGPIELRQNGMAVIGRLPITIEGDLWGFSAIIIYMETLIEKSGINRFPKDRYYFQLSKVNPNTKTEEFFFPVNEDIEFESFSSVNFPEGDWRLYAKRVDTEVAEASFWVILVISIFGAIACGFMTTKIARKPKELEMLLEEKSEKLILSRESFKKNSELLRSILEGPKGVLMYSLDIDYNYLAFTASHKKLMKEIWNQDIEVGENMLDFILDEHVKELLITDFKRALKGEYFEYVRAFGNDNISEQYWENRFAPINTKDGKTVGLTAFVTNITQRVKAEQEIKLEKQLSDSIINSLPGIFYLFNKEGKYLRWNKNLEEIGGYNYSEIESLHPLDFFPEEEHELLAEKIGSVFESDADNVEAHLKTKDGEKIPFFFTGASMNYRGEECLLGVGIDITNQKKAEKEHKKIFQQLQNHLYNSPLGVVEYDHNLNIVGWSPRCKQIFGWNEEKILGKNAFDIIYEKDKTKTEVVANELSTGSVDYNISNNRNYTKSGKIIDCIWYNSVVKDEKGEILTVMSLVEDITEKKKAEESIRQNEKRYRTLISNSPYCIHEIDLEQKISSMNKAGLEMMGVDKEQDIVGSLYGSMVEGTKYFERITNLFQQALKGESIEFEFESNDGRNFLSSFIPILDGKNEVQRVMGITQDITERKKSAEIIENSLKEKTTLLSEIHHRVKNNLAIVSGLLQLQMNEVKDEKVTTVFEQSINRIISIAMVHELMYKSPNLSSVNVNSYLEMLIPAISASMQDESKNITFKIDIEEYKLNINEAIPLGLLLNELITNSFKYAFNGNEDGEIKIKLSGKENEITILYEDNGVGFDETTDFNTPENLGLNLIHAQLQQLDAEYEVETNNKFKLEFNFKVKPIKTHTA